MTRLGLLQQWAEAQGLELAAECHLVRLSQAAELIRADKSTADQVSESGGRESCHNVMCCRSPVCPPCAATSIPCRFPACSLSAKTVLR